MAVIRVELAGRAYDVRVGGGLLADLPAQCGALLRNRHVPCVSDSNVSLHSSESAQPSLASAGF